MFPIDVLRFSGFGTMRNHFSEILMLNDIQISSDRTIRSLVQGRIHKLKNCVNSRPKSVFKDQEAVKCLSSLHDKYNIVPADKASNNIVFVCKSYYFECLIKEMFPIDVLRFSGFGTMRNHFSEILMLNDIQISSDYMSRWVVLKRRVGAVKEA
jgi:hypothetical protein